MVFCQSAGEAFSGDVVQRLIQQRICHLVEEKNGQYAIVGEKEANMIERVLKHGIIILTGSSLGMRTHSNAGLR